MNLTKKYYQAKLDAIDALTAPYKKIIKDINTKERRTYNRLQVNKKRIEEEGNS
jgi:hypothetical protein